MKVSNVREGLATNSSSTHSIVISSSLNKSITNLCDESFIKHGISGKLFVLDEGKSSCYIDAVAGKMAKSSFENAQATIDITDAEQIKTVFLTF